MTVLVRAGVACPRCEGQILRLHPQAGLACLACGYEPVNDLTLAMQLAHGPGRNLASTRMTSVRARLRKGIAL